MAKRNALKVLRENVAAKEKAVIAAADHWHTIVVVTGTAVNDPLVDGLHELGDAMDALREARALLARVEGT